MSTAKPQVQTASLSDRISSYRRKTPFNPSISREVFAQFQKLKTRLSKMFSEARQKDPQQFNRILATYARLIFKADGPGRPNDETVTEAVMRRKKNQSWPTIYRALQVSTPEAQSKLRDAARRRRTSSHVRHSREARNPGVNDGGAAQVGRHSGTSLRTSDRGHTPCRSTELTCRATTFVLLQHN